MCDEPVQACIDEGTMALVCSAPPIPVAGNAVHGWSTVDKVGSAIRRSFSRMPGETAAKLASLLDPTALAVLAGTLLLWAGSHAVGIGEAIDLLMIVTGFVFIGWDAINAVKHLFEFARRSATAETDGDLDAAGEHLAQAVAIIGVDVVLAFLTHRAVKAWKGRYKPTTVGDPTLQPGAGVTTWEGDITYSTAGTDVDRALVLYHEQVHQFLTPKLQAFRGYRIDLRATGYAKSQLLRYLEEALAESYAQLRVNGVKGLPAGMRFPIDNAHYQVTISGILREGAIVGGIYLGAITVGGIIMYVYLEQNP
jgi:hypothetical protein